MALTDLRGNLGKLNTDFEVLRRGVELAADGMQVTYVEAANLGKRFMEMSGGGGINQISIGRELGLAGGFARGYGLDPSQGVSFMSTMRRFGATNDESGTRRMAMLIGEAVGRVGFARAGEMMQAVTGFVSTAQRSLSAPNVGGYVDALSKMVGMHPGLDVPGASGILNKANAAFMSGGAAGPASQNFMLGVYQNAMGRDVSGLMTPFLDSQGLFGTPGGAKSLLGKVLKGKDLSMAMGALSGSGAGTPMIDMLMNGIKSQYGDGTFMQIHAVAGHLGISPTEAASLIEMTNKHGSIGGMAGKLKAAGVDASKIKAQNIPALAGILGASGGDLHDMAGQYGVKAGGKSDDVLRKELLKVASDKTIEDEGSKTRSEITKVENAITGLGAHLLPAVNWVREAVLFAAGRTSESFKNDQYQAWLKLPRNAGRYAKIEKDFHEDSNRIEWGMKPGPDQDGARKSADHHHKLGLAALRGEFDAAFDGVPSIAPEGSTVGGMVYYDALEQGRKKGLTGNKLSNFAALAMGLASLESGFNQGARGKEITNPKSMHFGNSAIGVMQLMPKTAAGLGVDPYDLSQNISGGNSIALKGFMKHGIPGAVDAFFGTGPNGDGSHTQEWYRDNVRQKAIEFGYQPEPNEITINIKLPDGSKQVERVRIPTRVSPPTLNRQHR